MLGDNCWQFFVETLLEYELIPAVAECLYMHLERDRSMFLPEAKNSSGTCVQPAAYVGDIGNGCRHGQKSKSMASASLVNLQLPKCTQTCYDRFENGTSLRKI